MQPSLLVDLPTLEQVLDRAFLIVTVDTLLVDVIALMGDAAKFIGADSHTSVRESVLVTEQRRLVGILTAHDVVRLMATRTDYLALPVSEVMVKPVITLPLSTAAPAVAALSLMHQQRIRHLPVVDEWEQPVGVITQDRLLQALDPVRWLEGLQALQGLVQKQTQWQATQDALEQRVAKRTAELVLANAYLRQRETQWQGLFDNALDAIAITDDTGQYIDANPSACALFGVPKANLLGLNVADFSAPELDFQQVWQHFLQQGFLSGEFRLYRQDGTIREVEFNAVAHFIPHRHLSILRDISDRKQIEADLRQSEARFRSVFENAGIGIVVASPPDFKATSSNRSFQQFLGYSAAELSYLDFTHFTHPDDLAQETLLVEECRIGNRNGYQIEKRFIRKDGQWVWGKLTTTILRDAAGELQRAIAMVEDINDRKHAEVTLQQQLVREQLIAEMTRSIRQTLDVNEVLQRTVDQVRQTLQTDRVVIFRFHPNWQGLIVTESVDPHWPSILSTTISDPCFSDRYIEPYRQGRISTISNLQAEEIEPCYVELLAHFQVQAHLVVPIRQGNQLWGLLIAHHCAHPRQWQHEEIELLRQLADQVGIAIYQSELYQQTRHELLERQRVQDALQESEERFRSLSTSAPVGILQMNADGICLYANARWQEMAGLKQVDCLGNGWMQTIHPEDQHLVGAARERLLQQHQEYAWEFRLLAPNQDIRWISAHAAPMRSTTSEIIGYVITQIDITERKQAEITLQEKQQLEAQFYRAQRLESLGTLASGMAHDLNNVFTPILVLSQLLEQKLPTLDTGSREILATLRGSARHGAELIQQILVFTRGTEGNPTLVQVSQLLLEIVKVIEKIFPKSIAICQNIALDLWLVEADSTQLHQVLMNLCVNARDAMPDGGTLTVAAENCYVHDRLARLNIDAQVGNYVLVTVADTGTGMTPELLDRIFDPFFTTKEVGKGTGLGLATVLGIVKRHKGFLQVSSQIGQGTLFKVYLPAHQPENINVSGVAE